jgi:hypothetical protein
MPTEVFFLTFSIVKSSASHRCVGEHTLAISTQRGLTIIPGEKVPEIPT